MIPRCTQCGGPWTGNEGNVCPACRLRSGLPTAGELYAEFGARFAGSPPSRFDALCRKHPEHAEELRSLHAMALSAQRPPESPRPPVEATDPASATERPKLLAELWPSGSRYRVESVVARRGTSARYSVRDRELDRLVEMRVLGVGMRDEPSLPLEEMPPGWVERFVEEAKILARLDHPGILPVYDFGLDARGRPYFTTKRVQGRPLSDLIGPRRHGREGWDMGRTVRALLQACEAVAYAHQHGVLHRNLGPERILLGNLGEVYVLDWTVACCDGRTDLHDLRPRTASASVPYGATDSEPSSGSTAADTAHSPPVVTRDGTIWETPAYLSPELARGRLESVGPPSDVYSLGAILYELLAGHGPYLEDTPRPSPKQVLDAVRAGPPSPLARRAGRRPPALVAICGKAMEREPSARYPHAGELVQALRAWLDGRVSSAWSRGTLAGLKAWLGG